MINILKIALMIMLISFVPVYGCSGNTVTTGDILPATNPDAGAFNYGESILGLFEVTLDTDNLEITLKPVRNRSAYAVGDIFFDLEITDFMVFLYCPDETCLMVGGLGVVDDTANGDITPDITFDIYLKHPFDGFDISQPPSGFNRADLDIFNPKVYILNAGNQDPLVMTSEAGKVVDTGLPHPNASGTIHTNINFVQNPDGWGDTADANHVDPLDGLSPEETSILMTYQVPEDFPGTDVHPFFNFFYGDETDGGTDNPKDNDCRMSQGEDSDVRTVQLNLEPGEGEITFALAVAGSYGQSAQGKINRVPSLCKYFVPAFNTHMPVITDITVVPPDPISMTDGTVTVYVRDMQADASGVASSKSDYTSQADGGSLLPPEIVDYSNTSYPVVSGLTMEDFLLGETGELVYRVVDPDDVEIIPVTTIDGTQATGSGTAADPYVFNILLEWEYFDVMPTQYTMPVLTSDKMSTLKESFCFKIVKIIQA